VTLTRREILRLAAAAAAGPLVPRDVAAQQVAAGSSPIAAGRFFNAREMALLDELTELIIPADEHSGGARAAQVAALIDGTLADYDPQIPDLAEQSQKLRAGLALVDALAVEATGKPFLEASAEERTALLEGLAAKEKDPESEAERFFVDLKDWTSHAYYTSRIGIHDELEYKGNTLLTEFVGTDPATLPSKRTPG